MTITTSRRNRREFSENAFTGRSILLNGIPVGQDFALNSFPLFIVGQSPMFLSGMAVWPSKSQIQALRLPQEAWALRAFFITSGWLTLYLEVSCRPNSGIHPWQQEMGYLHKLPTHERCPCRCLTR